MRQGKPLNKKVKLYIGHNFATRERETRVTNKLEIVARHDYGT